MIIIEGPRNVGKTFLISKLSNKYITSKFNFAGTYKYFNMDNKTGKGFAFGKDIQLLTAYTDGIIKNNIIIDRCFLSSVVYGILDQRITIAQGEKYLQYLKSNYNIPNILLITGINPVIENKRNKKDGWEHLSYEKQIELYNSFYQLFNKKIYLFYNDFTNDSIIRFKKIVGQLS